MNVWIDADGCPVVKIAAELCRKYQIRCTCFCDTAHEIRHDYAKCVIVDKGSDNVDFALVNQAVPGDLIITQDYGLASMCLARGIRALHQDGWEYTPWNIEALLFQRHTSAKIRRSGGRTKGPSKRTAQQNDAFREALDAIIKQA